MIEVYIDGATNGEGLSGAGIYIKKGKEQSSYSYHLGKMTNHEAEFNAFIKAMEICGDKYPDEIISVRSDSQLVADAINKQYCKNDLYKELLTTSLKLQEQFPMVFIKWIPEKQNKIADQLAKSAIHNQ